MNWSLLLIMELPALLLVVRGLLYIMEGPQDVHARYVTRGTAASATLAEGQSLWEWVRDNVEGVPHEKWERCIRLFGGMLLLMGVGLGTMAWGFDPAICRLPIAYSLGLTVVASVLFGITLHFKGPAYLVVIAYVTPMTGIMLNCVGISGWSPVGISLAAGICCSLVMWVALKRHLTW